MATSSNIHMWKIPWIEEPAVHGILKDSDTTDRLSTAQPPPFLKINNCICMTVFFKINNSTAHFYHKC